MPDRTRHRPNPPPASRPHAISWQRIEREILRRWARVTDEFPAASTRSRAGAAPEATPGAHAGGEPVS
jgi:hypothetical protein